MSAKGKRRTQKPEFPNGRSILFWDAFFYEYFVAKWFKTIYEYPNNLK